VTADGYVFDEVLGGLFVDEREDSTRTLTAGGESFHLRGHHVQRAHTRTALRVGEPHTGAMIALVPRAEDLKRLPINGGEPKSELHLTLWFLGDAVDHSNDARETLITALSENHPGPVQGRAFGAAYWNPTGDDPCWVLNVGELPTEPDEDTTTTTGHWSLEQARVLTADALLHTQLSVPEQHAPWSPHICLAYAKDTSLVDEVSHRVGTVTFDTLRIAFGDEVTDIDLGAPE
jgi:2'-5' RNA ligase